jgi:AraC family transcriptional regulator, arabinose operon regulatory protein
MQKRIIMTQGIKNFLRSQPSLYNCCYIADNSGEKLSGGFFQGTRLREIKRMHKHNYFAFVYLLDGTGTYSDYLGHHYQLKAGSLFFRFPEKPYAVQMDDKNSWLEFAVAIPDSFHSSLISAKIIDEKVTFLQTKLSKDILKKAIEFVNSLEVTGSPQNTAYSYATILDILSALLCTSSQRFKSNTKLKNLLEQVKLLLGNNLNKKMCVPKEVAKLGMGYEAFRKHFAAEYGISPKAYRISRRLDKADVLLLHTDTPIKQIADSLGYPTDSDFIRQYKKHRSYSPGMFRKSLFR